MAEEQIILKRKAENKCIICGKEIDKQETITLNYLDLGEVAICKKHIKC